MERPDPSDWHDVQDRYGTTELYFCGRWICPERKTGFNPNQYARSACAAHLSLLETAQRFGEIAKRPLERAIEYSRLNAPDGYKYLRGKAVLNGIFAGNQPLSLQKIRCGGRFAAAFLIATFDNSEIHLNLLESAHTHFLIATRTAFSEIRIICPAAISPRF